MSFDVGEMLNEFISYDDILEENNFKHSSEENKFNTKLPWAIRYDGQNKDRIEVRKSEWSHYLSTNIQNKDLIASGKDLKSLKKHLKTLIISKNI